MKTVALALVPLLATPYAWALPANTDLQEVFQGVADASGGLFHDIAKGVERVVDGVWHKAHDTADRWVEQGKQFIKQDNMTYELVIHPSFADYQLRVIDPMLCDPSVKQHSGYLDITDGKHLFFWFFEARNSPDKAPLTLWLNGGPGGSSSTGLLFELGPCNIANGGSNTTYNEYSWITHSNVIFLDQPVNVGYSYSDDGSTISTSPAAALDVYAFLELFIARYPEYADAPFHLAAESYGGTYAPNIASVIYKKNAELKKATAPSPDLKHINLASVILANGLTDPFTQMATVPDFACDGPFPMYDDPNGPQCTALRSKVPTCQRLIKTCYKFDSKATCVPALAYCDTQLVEPLQQTGLNPYDVRRKCNPDENGMICYKEMLWVDKWLDLPEIKKALGVSPKLNFSSVNWDVNQAFFAQGDGSRDSAKLLPELVNDGVRLLVYAGNADAMCNFIGNEAWMVKLEHKFHEEFSGNAPAPWVTLGSGRVAGRVRSAGGDGLTAGNVTFVEVFDAGHMVPFDQPEAALDLFTRWITDVPLTLSALDTIVAN